jgi:hypothetical protein
MNISVTGKASTKIAVPAVLAFNRSLEPWLVNGRKHDSGE